MENILREVGFETIEEDATLWVGEGLEESVVFKYKLKRNGKIYCADVKKSKTIGSYFNTGFHRSYTKMMVVSRQKPEVVPLMIIEVDKKVENPTSRESYFENYAPECDWLCIEPGGYYIGSVDGESIQSKGREVDVSGTASGSGTVSGRVETDQKLRFSDLELWMFKCLFYHQHPPAGFEKKFEESIDNGNDLRKFADVSHPTVYEWLNAMDEKGYLNRKPRKSMRLVRIGKYLERWTGKYYLDENPGLDYFEFLGQPEDPFEKLREHFSNLAPEQKSNYRLTGQAGARAYGKARTTSGKIHLYLLHDDAERLRDELNLIDAEENESNVVCIRPKYTQAIKRSYWELNNLSVVDPIQLYLDCYHLPERGREQSEYLLEKFWPEVQVVTGA